MARMGGTHGSDAARVRSRREPVEEFRPDRPAPLAAPGVVVGKSRLASDQQDDSRALRHGQRQAVIEPGMGHIERGAVQI
jgi:hypothetical protein